MLAAGLTLLTPLGLLATLVLLLPLAALIVAARRAAAVARLLGLRPAGTRGLLVPAILAAVACVCAGLAAAQPVLRTSERAAVRSQSQILYVVDVSRSMAAAPSATEPTRLARARDVVRRLHAATGNVPSGLAGMTDRVLPYLFPTANGSVFAATLRASVLLEAPPPQQTSTRATTFASLTALAGDGYFAPSAKTRTCVLVTDGESRSYSPGVVADALRAARCRLLVVRVGGAGEHVFGADGVPEAGYAPDPAAAAEVDQLVEAAGGRAFGGSAGAVSAAASALYAAAEQGPTSSVSERTSAHALAPWLALAGVAAVLALALDRLRKESFRDATTKTYDRSMTATDAPA